MIDLGLSLEQLDGVDWGEPAPDDTNLIKAVHALRRKPLCHLTNEEVRLALSQRVGDEVIVELALLRLEVDPLAEGDCYPGDILAALIKYSETDVWQQKPEFKQKLQRLYKRAMSRPSDETDALRDSLGLPTDGFVQ
ncbi:MAG: contact-dependent growth inhibition system immunity protein [Sphingomonas sp.]